MAGRTLLITAAGALAIIAGIGVNAAGAGAKAAVAAPSVKPPAPGPQYVTRLDHARLMAVKTALEKKEFSLAKAETARIEDRTARSLGEWLYFMSKDKDVDVADAGAFLRVHADWPATSRIQAFVESRLSDSDSAQILLDFFDGRPPRTGNGKIQLARAMLSTGRGDEATALIKDAWINHNFRIAEERRILNVYGSRLSEQDHADRVDRLLWARQVTNARRTFPHLSSQDRRMAEARAALLLGAATGPRLYRNLPKDERLDSGVLHAAVRYYRRTDDQQYAMSLASDAPDTAEALRNTDRWWTERRLLLQWALKQGRPVDAYKVAAQHGIADGLDFSDAEFVAGWIALRFLNEPERALTHFEAMTGSVATPISISRGFYWLGRAADAAGDDEAARSYYRISANHHYSFYGQLAAEKLGGVAVQQRFDSPVEASTEDKALFNARPSVAALRILSDLNLDYEFMLFAYHVDDHLERPGEFVELARLTNGEGAPHLTVRAGKVATQRGAFTAHVSYPTIFVPEEARAFVAPEIILGLSRQESEFNPRAYSSAGARGVMQLIPSTAQITARKEGLPYRRSALLDDPVYNMTIGSAHLSHLLDRFDGSLVMTFAAYNAGAHRATQWAEDFGDPRTGEVDPLDWIELIPFSETRNYVQRVLENVQVYRGRLNETAIPGRLAADIERGGPNDRVARAGGPSARLAALYQSRGTGAALADLPARTALLAASFRENQRAVLTPPAAPKVAPAPDEKAVSPQNRDARRGADVAPKTNPVLPAPQATPLAEDANARTSDEAVEPEPIALTQNSAASQGKLDNPITPPPAAQTGAEQRVSPAPTMSPSQPDLAIEPRPAPDGVTSATEGVAASSREDSQATSEFAAQIIEKASTRLQIEDNEDALAAAIVRGLQQMEDESVAEDSQGCVAVGELADGDGSDAAALNEMMIAQLSGDETCEE